MANPIIHGLIADLMPSSDCKGRKRFYRLVEQVGWRGAVKVLEQLVEPDRVRLVGEVRAAILEELDRCNLR